MLVLRVTPPVPYPFFSSPSSLTKKIDKQSYIIDFFIEASNYDFKVAEGFCALRHRLWLFACCQINWSNFTDSFKKWLLIRFFTPMKSAQYFILILNDSREISSFETTVFQQNSVLHIRSSQYATAVSILSVTYKPFYTYQQSQKNLDTI